MNYNLINSKINMYLGVFLFIFSIVYSFIFCYYGLDFTDSFFYLNSISDFKNYPLWLGTSAIGKIISLFGEKLIYYRIANCICYILAAIIPNFILIPLPKLIKNIHWLAFIILSLNILSFNVFGIDGFTILFLSITTTIFIKYFKSGKTAFLILSGIFSAILIQVRFPNLLIIPIFVFFNGWLNFHTGINKNKILVLIKTSTVYILITTTLYLLFFYIIFKEADFINRIASNIPNNSNSSYSLKNLIVGYLSDLSKLIKYIGLIFLIIWTSRISIVIPKYFKYIYMLFITAVLGIFLKYDLMNDSYTRNFSMFISAIVYSIVGYIFFKKLLTREYKTVIVLTFILSIAIIPVFGSNTRLLKLAPILICFAPFLILNYNIKLNNFIIFLTSIFFVFMIYLKTNSIYEDSSLKFLTNKPLTQKISNISTTPNRADLINDVMNHYDSLKIKNENNIIFWGRVSHVFCYLTKTNAQYKNSFWMLPNDEQEILNAEKMVVNKYPIIFFIPTYPQQTDTIHYTQFEKMLISHHYICEDQRGYKIYHPAITLK